MSTASVASIYIHAPFCARRCFYCDFAVSVRSTATPGPWAAALAAELALIEAEGRFELVEHIDTLYVGGGTPSLLGPDAMAAVASVLTRERLRSASLEWTAEANPESLTPEVARAWKRAGVGRLSLGTQSFQESVLRWMGRLHGADGSVAAVDRAKSAGLTDVSVDLIFGLPTGVDRDWSLDLDRALALDVPHISLYGLTAEARTPLGRGVAEGRIDMADDTRYAEEYLEASARLTSEGYEHYEVSNFARPGHRSRHNAAYWDGSAYLGLGNGAHSFSGRERRWNVREWEDYRAAVEAGRSPVAECESLDPVARRLETVWLGLRTSRGLPVTWADHDARARLVEQWCASGKATIGEGCVRLSPEGWLTLDRLAVDFDEAWDQASPGGARGPASEAGSG